MFFRRLLRPRRGRIFLLFLASLILLLVFVAFRLSFSPFSSSFRANFPVDDLRQREYVDSKGIHVIVAYYTATRAWESRGNLSKELSNLNEYSPIPGEGERGNPVYIPSHLISRSRTLYRINQFNLMASDRISVDRKLPDLRIEECKKKSFLSINTNVKTSVIIVFHDEAWSTLARTVHSVINNSPSSLLQEIILVDDASTKTFLGKSLDEYMARLRVPVQIIRLANREGLIRARLKGAEAVTKGEILTFLDAHCECSVGWLEPLIARILQNRSRIVCPTIDVISDDTFAYMRSFDFNWGTFNWNLHFRWLPIDKSVSAQRTQHPTVPFKTPVMAGGLFSIDRSYFQHLGSYDSQMNIWGGENIELSLRAWMCGGSIEIVPCSRVGHVFRKSSPYTFPGGVANILHQNLARVAETWLDEWKNFFYKLNPEAKKIASTLDVTERRNLRRELKCQPFSWYLQNVWPRHFFPTTETFFGKIRNLKTVQCIQRPQSSGHSVGNSMIKTCLLETFATQLFVISKDGYIYGDDSVCLGSSSSMNPSPVVSFSACNQLKIQQWKYSLQDKTLIHEESLLCLDLPTSNSHQPLRLRTCSQNPSQKWQLESISWK